MIKEKDEIQAAILRVTQSVVLYVPTYSKFGGYEGERSIYTADIAHAIYRAGYRKQVEGEWKYDFALDGDCFYICSVCGRQEVVNGLCAERNPAIHYPYCHCGAKMKGGNDNGTK